MGLNRAERRALARTGQQTPEGPSAFMQDSFVPVHVNVISPEPGQQGPLQLQMFCGPVSEGTYVVAKAATFDPDLAIRLGEHLASEGRRIKSGLEIPSIGAPADLRAA